MGYIKEPEGVDFVINGKPLTDKQKKEISEFIKADKKRDYNTNCVSCFDYLRS